MTITTLSLQEALQRWNDVEKDFFTEINSPEPTSMRDRDIWRYAIDVYNAIQVGEKFEVVKIPFTTLGKHIGGNQRLGNLMWEIILDKNNIVLEKKYTHEGKIYSIRVDDTFDVIITPEDITTDEMWEFPIYGSFQSPIGKKIVEALDLKGLHVYHASENNVSINVNCVRDVSIDLALGDSAREVIRDWEHNNQVSEPITIEFKVLENSVGGRKIR